MKLLLCTPAYNFQCYTFYASTILKLDRLCRKKGIEVIYLFRNDSLITIARNIMANMFLLETDCSHLIFIDSDMEFEPENILQLIESDKPIIGLICAKKNINWNQMSKNIDNYRFNNKEVNVDNIKTFGRELNILVNNNNNNNILEVEYIGTGVMLIKREVFEKMKDKYHNDYYYYENKKYFNFFDSSIVNNKYLSEDYWFCQRWKDLGGNILLNK